MLSLVAIAQCIVKLVKLLVSWRYGMLLKEILQLAQLFIVFLH